MRCSIRTRLTLWFSAMMVGGLTVLSVGVLFLHARWVRAQFDAELASTGMTLSRMMDEELSESGNLRQAAAEARGEIEVPGRATAILDGGGHLLTAHWNGFPSNERSALEDSPGPRFTTVRADRVAWRVVTTRRSSSAGIYVVLVAGSLAELDRQQTLLVRVLLVATPLIALITAGVSWWVASSALRPVTIMAAEAQAITASSFNQTLMAPIPTDELGQLARAFNQLLGRLAAALQTQRQFMADASHELRTPVSVIQTAAEVTLEQEQPDDGDYREALTIVNEQSVRLGRMVEGMIVLARADAGGYRLVRRPLYVDDTVAECVRAVSVVAATRRINLSSSLRPDVLVNADDDLLHQLVTNLLENAVHYTPPGGVVTVAVRCEPAWAIITVSDTGPGIAAIDRERVFERFVRLDEARTGPAGAGLGLPIARWIAGLHGGTLTLEPNPLGGCLFVARLPWKPQATHESSVTSPQS